MPRGELFVLSAPSGTGKTTLIRNLMSGGTGALADVVFSVSHTTRAPRRGEVDGRDYHFVDHATFEEMRAADRFLEWARVHHNLYGTSMGEVAPRLEAGIDVILDIDVQGAERVFQRYPAAIGIFVMPPSYEALRERLLRRGLDDAEAMHRRLAVSLTEIERYKLYDHVIVNDEAARASEALAAVILARRHRRDRMEERAEAVLRDFQGAFQRDSLDPAEAWNPTTR
jgi:guanylate kinase